MVLDCDAEFDVVFRVVSDREVVCTLEGDAPERDSETVGLRERDDDSVQLGTSPDDDRLVVKVQDRDLRVEGLCDFMERDMESLREKEDVTEAESMVTLLRGADIETEPDTVWDRLRDWSLESVTDVVWDSESVCDGFDNEMFRLGDIEAVIDAIWRVMEEVCVNDGDLETVKAWPTSTAL